MVPARIKQHWLCNGRLDRWRLDSPLAAGYTRLIDCTRVSGLMNGKHWADRLCLASAPPHIELRWVLGCLMLTPIGDETTRRESYDSYLIFQGAIPEERDVPRTIKRGNISDEVLAWYIVAAAIIHGSLAIRACRGRSRAATL